MTDSLILIIFTQRVGLGLQINVKLSVAQVLIC